MLRLFLALAVFAPYSAYAVTLNELLESETRPTMAQLADAIENDPLFEKGLTAAHGLPDFKLNFLRSGKVADAVAAFERTFPGGYLYELGRDAVLLGDVFDAFYLSMGQPDRVRRLDASAPSFHGHDDRLTYEFLASNGINLENGLPEWPHIIFDTTSYSTYGGIGTFGASQSVQLIRSGYQAFVASGGDPRELVSKFNFIAVGPLSNYVDDIRLSSVSVADALEIQRQSVTEMGFARPINCSLAELTYGTVWHEHFRHFEKDPVTGKVTAPKGTTYPKYDRRQVLKEMYQVHQIVTHPSFKKRVYATARGFGFIFPKKRTSELKPTKSCQDGFKG